jgi:hypothetical protein
LLEGGAYENVSIPWTWEWVWAWVPKSELNNVDGLGAVMFGLQTANVLLVVDCRPNGSSGSDRAECEK